MDAVHQVAQQALSRREHSVHELREKLRSKGYALADIERVLSMMIQARCLSDSRFAQVYTRYRANAGVGRLRIAAELHARGVSDDDIALGLAAYDGDFIQNAKRLTDKRLGAGIKVSLKDKAKHTRFLQSRGFLHDEIKQVMANEECSDS